MKNKIQKFSLGVLCCLMSFSATIAYDLISVDQVTGYLLLVISVVSFGVFFSAATTT